MFLQEASSLEWGVGQPCDPTRMWVGIACFGSGFLLEMLADKGMNFQGQH